MAAHRPSQGQMLLALSMAAVAAESKMLATETVAMADLVVGPPGSAQPALGRLVKVTMVGTPTETSPRVAVEARALKALTQRA